MFLFFIDVKADFFNDFYFTSTSKSIIKLTENIEGLVNTKKWIQSLSKIDRKQIIPIKIAIWNTLILSDKYKDFSAIKNIGVESLKENTLKFYTKAFVINIFYGKTFYWKACPLCNKSVKSLLDESSKLIQQYNCFSCNRKFNDCEYKFCYRVNIGEEFDQISCSVLGILK